MAIYTKSFEVVRTRASTGQADDSQIRIRRGRGPWETHNRFDDLPTDARETVQRFFRPLESEELWSHSADGLERPTRAARRRPAVRVGPDRLRLEYRWFDWPQALIVAIGVPVLLYGSIKALSHPSPAVRVPAIAVGLALIVLAAAMVYYGVALLLNRTGFDVCDRHLTVRHGPLPWFGARSLDSAEVAQLFCRTFRGRYCFTYALVAELDDGRHVTLLNDIPVEDEAVRLERAIERRLGIPDRPCYR